MSLVMYPNVGPLRALATAIQQLYRTPILHLETVWLAAAPPTANVANVEVFALIGPAESHRCFAWPTSTGEAVVILAGPQINSAEEAVRAYYAAQPEDANAQQCAA